MTYGFCVWDIIQVQDWIEDEGQKTVVRPLAFSKPTDSGLG